MIRIGSQQHSSCLTPVNFKENLGNEAGVLASGPGEWLLVREWESGGGSE